jgi:hypothetical protein
METKNTKHDESKPTNYKTQKNHKVIKTWSFVKELFNLKKIKSLTQF